MAPSTQAGEFVHEEIEHVRAGKHGVRSTKQAIAIGLAKARRAGVKLPPPKKGETSEATREHARADAAAGRKKSRKVNRKRSKASKRRLQREGRSAVSKSALSRQARAQAKKRTTKERSAIACKAARTRHAHGGSRTARETARTRRTA